MDHVVANVLARHDPLGEPAAVIFDSPHSGRIYPDDFDHALPRALVERTGDAFVNELYEAAPRYGATLLHALFPRAYIDPNRAPDDIDESLLDAPWPDGAKPGPKVALGIGLIAKREPGGLMYGRKLTVDEVRRRLDNYYWPYHRELERLLNECHARWGTVWHVNCHSMHAVSTEVSPEGPGVNRPDFCIGDRDRSTCDGAFTEVIVDTLRTMGYSVTVNDPYKGVELIRRYSNPANARHSVQIEVNRALYMHQDSIERNGGFDDLQANLAKLVKAVCRFARAHGAP
jgi:N-formylglutamate amidohydrolase